MICDRHRLRCDRRGREDLFTRSRGPRGARPSRSRRGTGPLPLCSLARFNSTPRCKKKEIARLAAGARRQAGQVHRHQSHLSRVQRSEQVSERVRASSSPASSTRTGTHAHEKQPNELRLIRPTTVSDPSSHRSCPRRAVRHLRTSPAVFVPQAAPHSLVVPRLTNYEPRNAPINSTRDTREAHSTTNWQRGRITTATTQTTTRRGSLFLFSYSRCRYSDGRPSAANANLPT